MNSIFHYVLLAFIPVILLKQFLFRKWCFLDSEEAMHILVSVVTISIAFAILLSGSTDFSPHFATVFVEVFLTLGLGFILHELAHKFVAQSYGAWAQYRMWTPGLILAVAMAVFNVGFVFAAPGAVQIYGPHVSKDKIGRIAFAGPMTNLLLALIFLGAGALAPGIRDFALTGAHVNAFLGAFNLIPIAPFDGEKVLSWSSRAWGALAIVFLFLLFGVL